ncbi:3-keto-disaccharide hydrolase [Kiritimatiella glycovorans]|uniref:3-keto-alpha-glucoside-1,2-lyase/3-keto-2-hydroxy-glucal hydratase domain-containing protein n=1 Tax=Kiritimatiella glycovorans TaxID=1307763 RepID=A0A0G3EHV8_9BACT|nr:DUF1080 domain-containing protein [Kiritimatiella glycovorans]AKJ64385.1 hypothetical protein L21SP4_01135 [Kiritimatiella glycovorans]
MTVHDVTRPGFLAGLLLISGNPVAADAELTYREARAMIMSHRVERIPSVDPSVAPDAGFEGSEQYGDYEGSIVMEGGARQTVAVRIQHRGATRVAHILPEFDRRVEPLAVLYESGTGDGIVFTGRSTGGAMPGGSWSLTLRNGRLEGQLSARDEHGRLEAARVIRPSPTLGLAAPEGADVLLGPDTETWRASWSDFPHEPESPDPWEPAGPGVMRIVPKTRWVLSRDRYRDQLVHLEFRTPFNPDDTGRFPGNSGIYLKGFYEIQILESYAVEPTYQDCGAIYHHYAPQINACAPPRQWQTFDLLFRDARYDRWGRKVEPARMTVLHNGLLVHDERRMTGTTGGNRREGGPHSAEIFLQNHGHPVEFRNIWVIKLLASNPSAGDPNTEEK